MKWLRPDDWPPTNGPGVPDDEEPIAAPRRMAKGLAVAIPLSAGLWFGLYQLWRLLAAVMRG